MISEKGNIIFSSFSPYETYYPFNKFHDQKPEDWWNGIIFSSRKLIELSGIDVNRIEALAISGHSLTSGSSAWIAITSSKPVLDFKYKSFVFAHVIDRMYTSTTLQATVFVGSQQIDI